MLEIKNLCKNYRNLNVINNLTCNIMKGEFVGLVGPNGIGKSTLIGCICGITKIDKGDVLLNGLSILKYPYETKMHIGVCFQDNIFDRFFNIFDTIRFNAMYHGFSRKEATYKTEKVLNLLKLKEKRKSFGHELSGGMKKRLQIALAIVHEPDLLILDEPFAGIDLELKDDLYQLLKSYNNDLGKTIILTSHYIDDLGKLCNRIMFMKGGFIYKDIFKKEADYLQNNLLEKLYREIYIKGE